MKIAVIGGAGVRTVIFINGLLSRYKKLNIDKVVLYDINQEKQQIIGKLCKHVINRRNEELQLEVVDNAVDAITGADYIVTTLRVGGDHSRVIDEQVALSEGVIGQETTGVGGFSMAVRTIPVLIEYCGLIKKYAPNAWIFNFTNPSGLVTQALRNAGYDRIIGICDAPSSTKFRMARELKVDEKDLYVEFFGLNHLSWIRSVKNHGAEILTDLLQNDGFLQSIQEFSMFDPDLLRSIGFLPNEYLYYYYHREKALANIIKSGATRGKTIEAVNLQMMEELKKIDIDAEPEAALQIFLYYMAVRESSYMSIETGSNHQEEIKKGALEVPDGMGYAGVMLDCIEGLQSEEGYHLVLSVENNGCIAGLEDKDVIEVICKVSKAGIHPVPIGEVPEACYLLIRMIKMYEKLTIKAIETNSKVTAIQALTLHPLINSYSLAKRLVEKYDEAYGSILGGSNAL
ncbi:MAG TPA: glycoside hydrolase [Mobilitalea sp.]|nr:glycoside hydrolase [Mobilitalea sp.]